jgi:hypothetical protein
LRDQAKRLAVPHQIARKTPNLTVASTAAVRTRFGYKSPRVAGVDVGAVIELAGHRDTPKSVVPVVVDRTVTVTLNCSRR